MFSCGDLPSNPPPLSRFCTPPFHTPWEVSTNITVLKGRMKYVMHDLDAAYEVTNRSAVLSITPRVPYTYWAVGSEDLVLRVRTARDVPKWGVLPPGLPPLERWEEQWLGVRRDAYPSQPSIWQRAVLWSDSDHFPILFAEYLPAKIVTHNYWQELSRRVTLAMAWAGRQLGYRSDHRQYSATIKL